MKKKFMKLRFSINEISCWASHYECPQTEPYIYNKLSPKARRRGYLTRREFLSICNWKTPRTRSKCEQNNDSFVREITKIAFKTKNDELKIKVLTLLSGVKWPTASAILHFCDRGKYPIIDVRTCWSVQIPKSSHYDIKLWNKYCALTRSLSKRTKLNMRTIDRALWQYSKEKQK